LNCKGYIKERETKYRISGSDFDNQMIHNSIVSIKQYQDGEGLLLIITDTRLSLGMISSLHFDKDSLNIS